MIGPVAWHTFQIVTGCEPSHSRWMAIVTSKAVAAHPKHLLELLQLCHLSGQQAPIGRTHTTHTTWMPNSSRQIQKNSSLPCVSFVGESYYDSPNATRGAARNVLFRSSHCPDAAIPSSRQHLVLALPAGSLRNRRCASHSSLTCPLISPRQGGRPSLD